MKCPKCGYLGFERIERCRNCGYDFSLSVPSTTPELSLRTTSDSGRALPDLPLTDAARSFSKPSRPDASRPAAAGRFTPSDLPLFESTVADDVPLITKPSPPRTPLAVRRATPEVPKRRADPLKMPTLDLELPDADRQLVATAGRRPVVSDETASPQADDDAQPAGFMTRGAALAMDLVILASIDAVVVYFTMQICGLTFADIGILPKGPLLAFLLVQNAGYLVAFTLGGQTLGKMAVGIKVIPSDSAAPLDLGRSIVRTLVWTALAVPAGLGFLTALFSRDHRGFHDRCAGTRVVRAA